MTIATLVLAARVALEALSTRLRSSADATLETADACAALRALADAWALVLPRLPADVTQPEWPKWRGRIDGHPVLLDVVLSSRIPALVGDDPGLNDVYADALDRYADDLRSWGREAAACEEEVDAEDDADEPAPYTLSALADPTPLPRGPEPVPLTYDGPPEGVDAPAELARLRADMPDLPKPAASTAPIDCPAAPGSL